MVLMVADWAAIVTRLWLALAYNKAAQRQVKASWKYRLVRLCRALRSLAISININYLRLGS